MDTPHSPPRELHFHEVASRGSIDLTIDGLSGGPARVSLHCTLEKLSEDERLGIWTVVRGDGVARAGWVTAPRCSYINTYAAGVQDAITLAGGPSPAILCDSELVLRDLSEFLSGAWDDPEHGYLHALPEILQEAHGFLSGRDFDLQASVYLNPLTAPEEEDYFYAALHLGSSLLRLLRSRVPIDDRTADYLRSLPLGERVSKQTISGLNRTWIAERLGIPLSQVPGGSRLTLLGEKRPRKAPEVVVPGGDWECMPVGGAFVATIDGTWLWKAVDADGTIYEGELQAGSKAEAAERIARELTTVSSCVSILEPRKMRQRKKTGSTRHTFFSPQADGLPEEEKDRVFQAAVELSSQVKTKLFLHLDGVMGSNVSAWAKPPSDDLDPYAVAVDAAWDNGIGAWAAVTGGGWHAQGDEPAVNTPEAELLAIVRGLSLYPAGSDVTVFTDSTNAEWVVNEMQGGATPEQIVRSRRWLGTAHGKLVLLRLHELLQECGEVTVQWLPRNSHPLHARADGDANRTLKVARRRIYRERGSL